MSDEEVYEAQGVSLHPSVEVHHGTRQMGCQHTKVWLNMAAKLAMVERNKNYLHALYLQENTLIEDRCLDETVFRHPYLSLLSNFLQKQRIYNIYCLLTFTSKVSMNLMVADRMSTSMSNTHGATPLMIWESLGSSTSTSLFFTSSNKPLRPSWRT